jgi:hypothetical protein
MRSEQKKPDPFLVISKVVKVAAPLCRNLQDCLLRWKQQNIRHYTKNQNKSFLFALQSACFPWEFPSAISDEEIIEIFSQCAIFLQIYHKFCPDLKDSPQRAIDRFLVAFWDNPILARLPEISSIRARFDDLISTGIQGKTNAEDKIPTGFDFVSTYYGLFLESLEPDRVKSHGIVYTPPWISRWMVQTIHYLHETHFIQPANSKISPIFFDPAVGSLNFEAAFVGEYYSPKTLNLPNIYGNELHPVASYLGAFFLDEILRQTHPNIDPLRFIAQMFQNIDFGSALSDKNHVRWGSTLSPIFVCGNPPYSVSSNNREEWITQLMKPYAVREPNITRLYDDYVKFIRYGHWLVEQHGSGIVCLITNRKYLDGKIFYGMRANLLVYFDALYILDLFGDQRNIKMDTAGANVFGIKTGIAICIFCKFPPNFPGSRKESKLRYLGIRGSLAEIQSVLAQPFDRLPFLTLTPHSPHFLFLPPFSSNHAQDPAIQALWDHAIPIPKCFTESSRAMLSSRDRFMIHIDAAPLKNRIKLLNDRNYEELRRQGVLGPKPDAILEDPIKLAKFNFKEMLDAIIPLNYRPFDRRYGIYYVINRRCGKSIILDQLRISETNLSPLDLDSADGSRVLGINFVHSMQHPPFRHILITRGVVDSGIFGYSTSKIAPLWIGGQSNLSLEYISAVRKIAPQATIGQMLGYLYGILYCKSLNHVFEPYLLHDFPRVVLPSSASMFESVANCGIQLIRSHLGEIISNKTRNLSKNLPFSDFPPHFSLTLFYYKNEIVLVAKDHVLHVDCPLPIWEFTIGSVPVVKHWLQDRTIAKLGRPWTESEWNQLDSLLFTVGKTLEIMDDLEKIFSQYLLL